MADSVTNSPARSLGEPASLTDSDPEGDSTGADSVAEPPAPQQTLVDGWLKFRDARRWKQRWGVVTKLSPAADGHGIGGWNSNVVCGKKLRGSMMAMPAMGSQDALSRGRRMAGHHQSHQPWPTGMVSPGMAKLLRKGKTSEGSSPCVGVTWKPVVGEVGSDEKLFN